MERGMEELKAGHAKIMEQNAEILANQAKIMEGK